MPPDTAIVRLLDRPSRAEGLLDAAGDNPDVLTLIRMKDEGAAQMLFESLLSENPTDIAGLAQAVVAAGTARGLRRLVAHANNVERIDELVRALEAATRDEYAFFDSFEDAHETLEGLQTLTSHSVGRILLVTEDDGVDRTGIRVMTTPFVRSVD